MVRRNLQTVSDARVREATGQGRDHWFTLLDSAGAREWPHSRIASHLTGLGMSGWWAQSVTVAYEQERGHRLPGQRPDGTFDTSASRTLRVSPARLHPLLADDDARRAWTGVTLPLASLTENSVRLVGPDGSRVTLRLDWVDGEVAGADAGGGDTGGGDAATRKVRVSVQHSWLASFAELERWRAHWRAALARLVEAAAD